MTAPVRAVMPGLAIGPAGALAWFFVGQASKTSADALGRQRGNLAGLHPGALRPPGGAQFQRQRKVGAGLLARQRHGDDRPRPLVDDVVAHEEHRAFAGLLMAAGGVQVGRDTPGHSEPRSAGDSSNV